MPRKPARCTGRPRRSRTSKSGAMREFESPPPSPCISPKLHTFAEGSATTGCAAFFAKAVRLKKSPRGHRLRNRDAQIGAARPLRLQFKTVDPREIALADPQCAGLSSRVDADAIERNGTIVVKHRCRRGCASRGGSFSRRGPLCCVDAWRNWRLHKRDALRRPATGSRCNAPRDR